MAECLSDEKYAELYGDEKPMTREEVLDYFKLETVNGETLLTFEAACLWLAFSDIGKPDIKSAAKRVIDIYYPAFRRGLDDGELINAANLQGFLKRKDLIDQFKFRMWLSFVSDDLEILANVIKKARERKSVPLLTECLKAFEGKPNTAEELIEFAIKHGVKGYEGLRIVEGANNQSSLRKIAWDGDSVYLKHFVTAFNNLMKPEKPIKTH